MSRALEIPLALGIAYFLLASIKFPLAGPMVETILRLSLSSVVNISE
jgi:hypothetical protein